MSKSFSSFIIGIILLVIVGGAWWYFDRQSRSSGGYQQEAAITTKQSSVEKPSSQSKQLQWSSPPPMTIDVNEASTGSRPWSSAKADKKYTAIFRTSKGDITAKLYAELEKNTPRS